MEALIAGAAVLGCCVVVPAIAWVLVALGLKKGDIPPKVDVEDHRRGDRHGEKV